MAERTKIWIADKMKELMKTKFLDKIRVTEICRFAEIERPTFYYHFKDKYTLKRKAPLKGSQRAKRKIRPALAPLDGYAKIFQEEKKSKNGLSLLYHISLEKSRRKQL
jgi:AcrR family transcriptional regulator